MVGLHHREGQEIGGEGGWERGGTGMTGRTWEHSRERKSHLGRTEVNPYLAASPLHCSERTQLVSHTVTAWSRVTDRVGTLQHWQSILEYINRSRYWIPAKQASLVPS